MNVGLTNLPGVIVLNPPRFGDERGWFCEIWNRTVLKEAGIAFDFVQFNHSYSIEPGTLRGLHYQSPPRAQDKLVHCSRGAIFDVVVDVRKGSPTYGQWFGVELTAKNGKQLFVPKGFLHGFITKLPDTEVQYSVTDTYAPDYEGIIRWDSLGIDWGLDSPPALSVKDATAQTFESWQSPFYWEGT